MLGIQNNLFNILLSDKLIQTSTFLEDAIINTIYELIKNCCYSQTTGGDQATNNRAKSCAQDMAGL